MHSGVHFLVALGTNCMHEGEVNLTERDLVCNYNTGVDSQLVFCSSSGFPMNSCLFKSLLFLT